MKLTHSLLAILLILFGMNSIAHAQETMKEAGKTIILIRHAKSSHDNPDWQDFERPLSDRGMHDAPLMGEKLQEMGVDIDLIISSPSQRTTETMQLFCSKFEYDVKTIVWDKSVYLSSSSNLFDIIHHLDDSIQTVAIVGHNPSMTVIANQLQADKEIDNVPTTGIVSVTFTTKSWSTIKQEEGKLDFFIYPKQFAAAE